MKMLKLLLFIIVMLTEFAKAQEIEPRTYANVPAGMNALALAYSWSRGNILTDATLPIEDFRVTAHSPAAVYLRSLNVFGKLGRIQVTVPFTYLAGDAKFAGKDTSGTRSGLADARLRLGLNLFGSPALAPKDFRSFKQETIVGASLVVTVPIGQYNASKLINLGANRWGFKPEAGISQRLNRWYLEAYAGVWLFTDNNEFLETFTLEQKPLYTFQWHVSYVFPSGIWAALDGVQVNGGETSVEGELQNNFQQNWRLGATLSLPLGRHHSVKAAFQSGVATRVGGDFDIVTIGYQYVWF
jgi:hypothetical protein